MGDKLYKTMPLVCPNVLIDNVIDFSQYKKSTKEEFQDLVYYLNNKEENLEKLTYRKIKLESITSLTSLQLALSVNSPSLIVVESNLKWASALELTYHLGAFDETPVILLCDEKLIRKRKPYLKEAYAAGVHDILYTPVDREEWLQVVQILLTSNQNEI